MKNTFNVGDRVAAGYDDCGITEKIVCTEDELNIAYGTVKEILSNNKVKVLFDEEWLNEKNITYSPRTGKAAKTEVVAVEVEVSFLLSEADAKIKGFELEKEFDVVMKQVEAKLKEAGKLVRDANKIAKKNGHELVDLYDATQPLLDAMDDSGWRSSSFNC